MCPSEESFNILIKDLQYWSHNSTWHSEGTFHLTSSSHFTSANELSFVTALHAEPRKRIIHLLSQYRH